MEVKSVPGAGMFPMIPREPRPPVRPRDGFSAFSSHRQGQGCVFGHGQSWHELQNPPTQSAYQTPQHSFDCTFSSPTARSCVYVFALAPSHEQAPFPLLCPLRLSLSFARSAPPLGPNSPRALSPITHPVFPFRVS